MIVSVNLNVKPKLMNVPSTYERECPANRSCYFAKSYAKRNRNGVRRSGMMFRSSKGSPKSVCPAFRVNVRGSRWTH